MDWVMGGILIASAAFCFVLAIAGWFAGRKELPHRPGEPAHRLGRTRVSSQQTPPFASPPGMVSSGPAAINGST
jgi:hypothetical protein